MKWPGAGVPRISARWKEEWQTAVDGAYALLTLDAARQYGLVTGGQGANVERCRKILEAGRARGFVPGPERVDRFIAELCGV
ncbi:MAG TPA: hypothetical protein VF521_13295, partial [Pyrinomonadaceae bacterium]